MKESLSRLMDRLSNFFALRKGLLLIVAIGLILANLVLQFLPGGWLRESNFLLHIGVIIALVGVMIAWAL